MAFLQISVRKAYDSVIQEYKDGVALIDRRRGEGSDTVRDSVEIATSDPKFQRFLEAVHALYEE